MVRVYLILLMLGLVFSSCDLGSDPEDPEGTLIVKGRITSAGQPVQGAEFHLGANYELKTTTDANGYFELKGVDKGVQQFKAFKILDNNKIIFIKDNVAVELDVTDIGELVLPSAIAMMPIDTSRVNESVIKVSWEKFTDADFVEYRLYRSNKNIFDETDGDLIFSTADVNVTSFEDRTFRTGILNNYRVFALSSLDKYSGSDYVSANVPGINLILNGSFETTSDGKKPNIWLYNIVGTPQFDYFSVSQQYKADGNNSLMIYYVDSLSFPPQGKPSFGSINQVIPSGDLIKNQEYVLSFWAGSEAGSIQIRLFKNGDTNTPLLNYIVPDGHAWQEHSFPFIYTPDINYLELWINTKGALSKDGIVKAFVDHVRLMK